MQDKVITNIRKAWKETNRKTIRNLSSMLEEHFKNNSLEYQQVDFKDYIVLEECGDKEIITYLCHSDILLLIVDAKHPDFINKCKFKDNRLEQVMVLFMNGGQGISELLLSKYEIEKRFLAFRLKDGETGRQREGEN